MNNDAGKGKDGRYTLYFAFTCQGIRGHSFLLLHLECWLQCETTELQRVSEPACQTVCFDDGVCVEGASEQVSMQQSQEEGM